MRTPEHAVLRGRVRRVAAWVAVMPFVLTVIGSIGFACYGLVLSVRDGEYLLPIGIIFVLLIPTGFVWAFPILMGDDR